MSGLALGWARKRRDAPSREAKSCLMFLADNCNEQIAFPSKRTLAEDMMCSEKTVMRLLQQLVEAGLLVRLDVEDRATKRTRTCGYYFPVQGRPPTREEILVFEREIGGRVTQVSPWEGDTGVPLEGDTGVRGRVTTVSPLNEPPEEPSGPEGPSTGASAREALFVELKSVTPKAVLAVSDQRVARDVLDDLAAAGVELGELAGCMRRWAGSKLFAGRKVPVSLERWLSAGMWEGWLPDGEAASAAVGAAAEEPEHPLMAAVLDAVRPFVEAGAFGSYLAPARIVERDGAAWLVALTGVGRRWIAEKCWAKAAEAWARLDGRPLTLISRQEFEALPRQGEGVS